MSASNSLPAGQSIIIPSAIHKSTLKFNTMNTVTDKQGRSVVVGIPIASASMTPAMWDDYLSCYAQYLLLTRPCCSAMLTEEQHKHVHIVQGVLLDMQLSRASALPYHISHVEKFLHPLKEYIADNVWYNGLHDTVKAYKHVLRCVNAEARIECMATMLSFTDLVNHIKLIYKTLQLTYKYVAKNNDYTDEYFKLLAECLLTFKDSTDKELLCYVTVIVAQLSALAFDEMLTFECSESKELLSKLQARYLQLTPTSAARPAWHTSDTDGYLAYMKNMLRVLAEADDSSRKELCDEALKWLAENCHECPRFRDHELTLQALFGVAAELYGVPHPNTPTTHFFTSNLDYDYHMVVEKLWAVTKGLKWTTPFTVYLLDETADAWLNNGEEESLNKIILTLVLELGKAHITTIDPEYIVFLRDRFSTSKTESAKALTAMLQ